MNLPSDLIQLAHLVRLSVEEVQELSDRVPQEVRDDLKLISDRVFSMAEELDKLAAAINPLLSTMFLQRDSGSS